MTTNPKARLLAIKNRNQPKETFKKESLLRIQQMQSSTALTNRLETHLALPPIYKTQPLRPLKLNVPQITLFHLNEEKKGKETNLEHNFISKKKNRKSRYMYKVLEKVVSENISPWGIESSHCVTAKKQKRNVLIRRQVSNGSALWQRQLFTLSNH